METEIESLIIQESCMVLNDSVELLVEDDKREKNVLCQRKAVLTDELEKLLALVEEKKREIEENDSLIDAVEKRISVAISGFQHVHSNMDAKYDSLQSTLSQLQLESQSLSVKRREIDEFLNLEKDKGEQLKKIAQLSIEDAEAYREIARLRKFLMSNILKTREDKASLSQSEDKLSKDVQMLQQEFHSASSSLQVSSATYFPRASLLLYHFPHDGKRFDGGGTTVELPYLVRFLTFFPFHKKFVYAQDKWSVLFDK